MIKNIVNSFNYLEPTYGGGLSNHLPMSLVALEGIGASEERILEYGKWYIKEKDIKTLNTKNDVLVGSLYDHLGKRDRYFELKVFFSNEIEKYGIKKTLENYSDLLVKGSSGDAFHGLIRLAYGIDSDNELEIISGLAYLSNGFMDFNIDVNALESHEPFDQVKRLKSIYEEHNYNFDKGLITGKMKSAASDERLSNALRKLPDDKCNKKDINELALKLFGGTQNFTLLHGFTSSHALMLLEPYLKDVHTAYQYHWLHLQIAYLSTGCLDLKTIDTSQPVRSWKDIFEKAIQSEYAHTHKVVYSLYECFMKFEDESWSDLYLYAADERLKAESL